MRLLFIAQPEDIQDFTLSDLEAGNILVPTKDASDSQFTDSWVKWQSGEYIQDAFPYLTTTERDFILTGMTPEQLLPLRLMPAFQSPVSFTILTTRLTLGRNLPMPKQSIDFESRISGIPCGIHIDTFLIVPPFKGPAALCDSDLDYYGYSDIEYTVLDRKGYPAPWLESKLTSLDDERIAEEITTHRTGD